MINRILIRIKVVQILYSYLLTHSEFQVEQPPQIDSRVRKFAYTAYLELAGLIIKLSEYSKDASVITGRGRRPKISGIDTQLIRNFKIDPAVRSLIESGAINPDKYSEIVPSLYDKIIDSQIFKDYKRRRSTEPTDEVTLWVTLLQKLISTDVVLIKEFRKIPDYSVQGVDLAVSQLSDTLRQFIDNRESYIKIHKELQKALDEAYKLYYGIFVLMVELTREQEKRLENAKSKYLATDSDLNPNLRFVENRLVAKLAENSDIKQALVENPLTWDDETSFLKTMLDKITSSDIYEEYMSFEHTTFSDDCEFWRRVLKYIIFPSEEFDEALENKSIYWNDDLATMGTFVLKTIRNAGNSESQTVDILPQYKDEEDEAFGEELFNYTLKNRDTYKEYIEKFINSSQWDSDRIAFMDMVIMYAALAELINYPAIPIPVTLNEYIEIANYYSTQRSGQFINGILYSVINYLKEQGIIFKD